MPSNVLILMGLRGSGKSTAGKLAATTLGWGFVDLDDLTPAELGYAVLADAFREAGEAAFRGAEVAVLRRVLGESVPNRVISLGGGTPMAPGAGEVLRRAVAGGEALLVYLRATPELLRQRLTGADNRHRPPLTPGAKDPLVEIEAIWTRRDPVYRSLAAGGGGAGGETIETDGMSMEEVAAAIVELIRTGR